MKQKEQLTAQQQKLEELTLKIEDVETLLDDVSDVAYDKAVEVVKMCIRDSPTGVWKNTGAVSKEETYRTSKAVFFLSVSDLSLIHI